MHSDPAIRDARAAVATVGLRSRAADLWQLIGEVVDGFARHRLLTYASAIAYQVVSSIIPWACFTLALFGLLNAESLWTDHLGPQVAAHASSEVYALLNSTVQQVLERKQVFWVTGGLVLALWEISGAMRATGEAMDEIYGIREHRSRRERYAISLLLAASAGGLMIAALVIAVAGSAAVGGGFALGAARYVVAAGLLMLAVGLTLRLAPSARLPFRWVGVGSIVIVAGWLIVIGGYVFYATHIASYSSIFGSLAMVFLLVIAVYLAAGVFLAGVLVDATRRDEER